ncbi:hypothetical protein GCM10017559_29290 [Streptosporangium longisporum]|uniref:Uncharacterized protein n=1 Tax=Streptosporangium longisporum TaxID=46187 RepID=A0ABP6KE83_9ACTN
MPLRSGPAVPPRARARAGFRLESSARTDAVTRRRRSRLSLVAPGFGAVDATRPGSCGDGAGPAPGKIGPRLGEDPAGPARGPRSTAGSRDRVLSIKRTLSCH